MIHDKTLRGILLAAERGLSIGITLHLPGMIVSGVVIGRKEWAEAYTQSLASAFQKSEAIDQARAISWAVDRQIEITTAEALPDDAVIKLVQLKDAHVYLNGGQQPIESPYWRGNVASLTGWHFRQLVTVAALDAT